MTVQKHKILVVAFSQFDLIYLCNKCKKSFKIQHIDLICEEKCLTYVSELRGIKFNIKHSFKEKRPGLLTPGNIYNIFRIQNFFKKKSSQYDKILIGVYRSILTSIFIKYVISNKNLYTIVVVPPEKEAHVKVRSNLKQILTSLLLKFFGKSDFIYTCIAGFERKADSYLATSFLWRSDPFLKKNIEVTSEALKKDLLKGTADLDKSIFANGNVKRAIKSGKSILLIGERTPVVHFYPEYNNNVVRKIFQRLESCNYQVFLRPRDNLTSIQYYNDINFTLLDSNQLLHSQILNLNPQFVLSFKSTASKTAAELGFRSYLLYPILKLDQEIMTHISHFTSDPRLIKLSKINDLESLLTK